MNPMLKNALRQHDAGMPCNPFLKDSAISALVMRPTGLHAIEEEAPESPEPADDAEYEEHLARERSITPCNGPGAFQWRFDAFEAPRVVLDEATGQIQPL